MVVNGQEALDALGTRTTGTSWGSLPHLWRDADFIPRICEIFKFLQKTCLTSKMQLIQTYGARTYRSKVLSVFVIFSKISRASLFERLLKPFSSKCFAIFRLISIGIPFPLPIVKKSLSNAKSSILWCLIFFISRSKRFNWFFGNLSSLFFSLFDESYDERRIQLTNKTFYDSSDFH